MGAWTEVHSSTVGSGVTKMSSCTEGNAGCPALEGGSPWCEKRAPKEEVMTLGIVAKEAQNGKGEPCTSAGVVHVVDALEGSSNPNDDAGGGGAVHRKERSLVLLVEFISGDDSSFSIVLGPFPTPRVLVLGHEGERRERQEGRNDSTPAGRPDSLAGGGRSIRHDEEDKNVSLHPFVSDTGGVAVSPAARVETGAGGTKEGKGSTTAAVFPQDEAKDHSGGGGEEEEVDRKDTEEVPVGTDGGRSTWVVVVGRDGASDRRSAFEWSTTAAFSAFRKEEEEGERWTGGGKGERAGSRVYSTTVTCSPFSEREALVSLVLRVTAPCSSFLSFMEVLPPTCGAVVPDEKASAAAPATSSCDEVTGMAGRTGAAAAFSFPFSCRSSCSSPVVAEREMLLGMKPSIPLNSRSVFRTLILLFLRSLSCFSCRAVMISSSSSLVSSPVSHRHAKRWYGWR